MKSFKVFAYLCALSAVFDLLVLNHWLRSPAHTALATSAVAVLIWPGSVAGFAAFHVVRLAAFVHDSPQTPNHQVLYAIASATLLFTLGVGAWKRRGGAEAVSADTWLAASAPALRVELLILYFYAVLHKLNTGYLDPTRSCASGVFERAAPAFLTHIDWPSELLIYGSLAAEATVPVLLSFRRTRLLGFAGGVLFHALLGLHWYHFSTGVFALYVLFVPGGVFAAASGVLVRLRNSRRAALLSPRLLLAVVALFVVATALARAGSVPVYAGMAYFWALGVLAALALGIAPHACRAHWGEPLTGRLGAAKATLVFPLVLFLFGASPYLGLRTVPTFSMFSNLRTEGGGSNHLLIPAGSLRIAGYQEDLVLVLDADDPELRGWAHRREPHVFHDLKLRVQEVARDDPGDIRVVYRRSGRDIHLAAAQRDPELMREIPWLARKWLSFRPPPRSNRPVCTW